MQSSTSRLSLAAWIKSIGQWILEWVPAGGNVSLDPFLFSIGRVDQHGGGTLHDGVHERPLGVEREVSASCPPLHGLLFPFRHLEQLQPGSAGLRQGFGAPRDQPRGPSVGRPETPSGLQRDLQPPGRVHRYRAPTKNTLAFFFLLFFGGGGVQTEPLAHPPLPGSSWQEKVSGIRQQMEEHTRSPTALLLSGLEETACEWPRRGWDRCWGWDLEQQTRASGGRRS